MFPSSLRAALLAQIAGALIAFALLWLAQSFAQPSLLAAAALQGVCASFVSWKSGAPRWWWLIHLLFMPTALLALALNIAPGWYLLAFALSLMVFWRTDRSRVPLYLSNAATAEELVKHLPTGAHVADLGCGDGRLLRRLAAARPDCRFTGIEHAPATWLAAKLINGGRPNVNVRYGDFWKLPLNQFDLLYVFLSPAPMAALWDKVEAEMLPGKYLISNSFPVPEVTAEQEIEVADRRKTRLFFYKTGLKSLAKPQK